MNIVSLSMMANYGLASNQHPKVGHDSKSFRCSYRFHDQTNATFGCYGQNTGISYKSTNLIYLDDKPLSLDTLLVDDIAIIFRMLGVEHRTADFDMDLAKLQDSGEGQLMGPQEAFNKITYVVQKLIKKIEMA
ncbi:hypothetical protein Tco_0799095 [Tanacetum coccineum]